MGSTTHSETSSNPTNGASSTLSPFLTKLLALTSNTPPNIARWSSDGKTYLILNDHKFQSDILKKYFKGTTQTFIRQLHFYEFKKVDPLQFNNKSDPASNITISWGFEHELFLRDKPELVKEIRRKTKQDPDSEKLASYLEVEALKNQVAFLQNVIEDLRNHVDNINNPSGAPAGNPSVVKVESEKENLMQVENVSVQIKKEMVDKEIDFPTKKRQRQLPTMSRNSSLSSFHNLCGSVLPPTGKTLERLNSFDFDNGSLSDVFSELDLTEITDTDIELFQKEQHELRENKEFKLANEEEAVRQISEATKVKESDVSKIVSYLARMNLGTSTSNSMEKIKYTGCDNVLAQVVPLRIQRVGAN